MIFSRATSSERPHQVRIRETSFSGDEDDGKENPKMNKFSTFIEPKNQNYNKETIELSEFIVETVRAVKDESLLFSKTKSYKEELFKASSQLFGADILEFDPCKGMDHVS